MKNPVPIRYRIDDRLVPINTKMELRPYQNQCAGAVLAARSRGLRRVYYVLPTGVGKTRVFVELIERMHSEGTALVLAHREELLSQARESILRVNPRLNVGVERAGCRALRHCDVVVASVQTLGRTGTDRLQWLVDAGPSVVVIDEAHHAVGDSYQRIVDRFVQARPHTFVVGCTATPARLDKVALHGRVGAPFEECVYTYEIRAAIEDGWLCQVRGYRVSTGIDLSSVKRSMGDYAVKDLAAKVNVEGRTRKAIEHWAEVAPERPTIVFCADVAHALAAADLWNEAGYRAAAVYGDMQSDERARLIAAYRSGQIQVLCNCQVLTEGFDAPHTSAIVMLRPTQSWSLFTQMAGRGTRIAPGKADLIVLDVVDHAHKLDECPVGERSKKAVAPPASVAGLLGLPDDIDLEGHTISEAADLKEQLTREAAVLEKYRASTFTDLQTMLEEVDMFRGVSASDHPAVEAASPYRWLQVGDDWRLDLPGGEFIRIRQSDAGVWWYRLRLPSGIEGQWSLKIDSLGLRELGDALVEADRLLEQYAPDGLHAARANARWRSDKPTEKQVALLTRRGYQSRLVEAMTKGEASALISKMLAGVR